MILKNLLLHQIWLVHKNQARPGLFISVLIVFWVQVCASWHVRERTSFTHNVRRGPCCRGLQSGFFRRHSDKLHMWRRLKVLIFRIMRTRHPSFHLRSTYDYLWAYPKPRFKPSTRVNILSRKKESRFQISTSRFHVWNLLSAEQISRFRRLQMPRAVLSAGNLKNAPKMSAQIKVTAEKLTISWHQQPLAFAFGICNLLSRCQKASRLQMPSRFLREIVGF